MIDEPLVRIRGMSTVPMQDAYTMAVMLGAIVVGQFPSSLYVCVSWKLFGTPSVEGGASLKTSGLEVPWILSYHTRV